MSIEAKFPPLTFTGNSLLDVVRFIKEGNVVALHTTKACRVFHAISFEQPESVASLEGVRVIYLDCNSMENLLGDGEWEWSIKDLSKGAAKELAFGNELRKAIIEQKLVPNKKYVSLGS